MDIRILVQNFLNKKDVKENRFKDNLCQPLDVVFLRPLKLHWRRSLLTYNNKKFVIEFRKPNLLIVFKNSFDRLNIENCTSNNLISGFKATGIYPLDENKIPCKLPTYTVKI